MSSSDESTLMSSVMFDRVYHMNSYLLPSNSWIMADSFVLKGIVAIYLGKLQLLGILPLGVTILLVNV